MASVLSIIKQVPNSQLPSLAGAPTREPLASQPGMQSFDSEPFHLPQCRNSASAIDFQPPLHRWLLEALPGCGTVTHQLPEDLLGSRGATANSAPTPGQLSSRNFLPVALYTIWLPQATEEARETPLFFKGCANMRVHVTVLGQG